MRVSVDNDGNADRRYKKYIVTAHLVLILWERYICLTKTNHQLRDKRSTLDLLLNYPVAIAYM